MPRIAVLVPAYKRPEYTKLCIESILKAQEYPSTVFYFVDEGGNREIIDKLARKNDVISIHRNQQGLRNTIIEFFNWAKEVNPIYIAKIDNDCTVPTNWLNELINVLETTDRDIVSPNVYPSNAAFLYGKDGEHFRPSDYVGGLWCMKASLLEGVFFEKYSPNGIQGAFNLIKQIIVEKEAKCGWVHGVTVEDIGHWSGTHPLHIKSQDHEEYSAMVGRPVSWTANN